MEEVVERANMLAALKRVKRNRGGPGVDGMSVDELTAHLRTAWPRIREELVAGTYVPTVVLRREIPKTGGGVRELGIPTVVDRLVQQAILQVLQPRFDLTFSEHSHGFRPGRRAHDAVIAAQRYVQEGRRWVVDVDLERFFDRVNHDVLMERLSRRIEDLRVLRVVRRYLEAGIMADGVVVERHEGTPQGGPLSPLLANVLLDEVDRELEARGHAFVRYADDCNVYVRSKVAGERVMAALRQMYGRLRLRVNEAKSAVAPATSRKVLGYSLWWARGREVKVRVAPKALEVFRDRVRELTNRNRGANLRTVVEELAVYLRGWKQYFHLAETPRIFGELDGWIRRRLRMLRLKQWKRGTTACPALMAAGVAESAAKHLAGRLRRWWWASNHPAIEQLLSLDHFDAMGLPRLAR
ncbi:MAG: group II intron reverse transcriptase/maturase [Deltaproteobacteria bacterium]|jgi:group II intron reverse transcriptase/maturase|nr:group II intron reverse transcriptase/maturase [Deltaproteobacteria bacterium]